MQGQIRILVCVKQVPETTEVQWSPEHTLRREFTAKILNPADESALELGLALRDRCGGSVMALTMGPAGAEGMLREILARGADDAVLLSDPAFAGADTLATARTLGAACRALGGFDLILCGRSAVDGETGQVGPMLASLLDIPCVSNVTDVRIGKAGDAGVGCEEAELEQLLETGTQTWRCRLPIAATLCEWSHRLRLPTLGGLRKANGAAIPRLKPEDIGLEPKRCGLSGSPTRVIGIHPVCEGRRTCEKLTVEELLARGVLP